MKRLLLLSLCLLGYAGTHAQGLVPQPIPCFEPKIYTPGITPGSVPELKLEGYNCVDLYGPIPAGGPNVIEKGHVDIAGGKYIHIGPGVHIGPMVDSVPPYTDPQYTHIYIGHNDFDVVWFEPNGTPGTVGQYEKLELGVKLPSSLQTRINNFVSGTGSNPLNPFDPDSIKIQADFYTLGNDSYIGSTPIVKTVYGFYYKEYFRNLSTHGWDEDTTSYSFRIRFAPKELGNYLVKIQIITHNETLEDLPISFTCVSSSNKGYVTFDNTTTTDRRKYMYYSKTDEPFFAIGNNLNWTDTGALYYQLESEDYFQISNWMNEIANYGANFTRISMIPYQYGLEWTDGGYNKLNNYSGRMTNAWEFDQVLNLAKSRNMYIDVHGEIHGDFQTEAYMIAHDFDHHPNTTWDRNPYNSNNQNKIFGINTPVDFITSSEARTMYKKKLRYIVSRWGYSTNVLVWELMSEIDGFFDDYNSSSSRRAQYYNWFDDMYSYLKNDLGVDQLISGSYAIDALEDVTERIWPIADIVLLHDYKIGPRENYDIKWKDVTNMQSLFFSNIPVLINEHGGSIELIECSQYFVHLDTWATAFMGSFGCGLSWNWKDLIANGRYYDYQALHDFFDGEYLNNDEYNSVRWTDNGSDWTDNTQFESFQLISTDKTKALCWFRDVSYWWTNEYHTNSCIQNLVDNGGDYYSIPYSKCVGDGYVMNFSPRDAEVHGLKESLVDNQYYQIDFYPTEYLGSAPTTITDHTDVFGTLHFTIPSLSDYGDMAFKVTYLGHHSMMPITSEDSSNASLLNDSKKELNLDVTIYPNPVRSDLQVQAKKEISKYTIVSTDGRIIKSTKDVNSKGFLVNTLNFERGMYQIVLEFSDQTKIVKPFVKER